MVVEGEHDRRAVLQAVDADVYVTKGHALTEDLIESLSKLQKLRGLIILTDPDFSGRIIRRVLAKKIAGVKHAYVARANALNKDDVGIEHADSESIRQALLSVRDKAVKTETDIEIQDLYVFGLSGHPDSSGLRRQICSKLFLEYGSAKVLHKQLALYGIKKAELMANLATLADFKISGETSDEN